MTTPAVKKPAKKTVPTEAIEAKKPKKAVTMKVEATPKPKQDTKALRSAEGPEGAAPRKAALKKASAKKAKLELEVETPALPLDDENAPIPKSAKARRPAKAEQAEPAAELSAPPAPLAVIAKAEAGVPAKAEIILEALREGRPLEFIFTDGDANPPRTFEPRQLTFDTLSQAWFVWGWDRRYNAERHHRIDSLSEVNQVEGMGRSAQGPYKEGTPANLLGGWLGGEPIPVKATLMKQWIFAVKQAPPAFPEFRITDAEDGKAIVTFTATDLRAISRWCMQFGDGIQIQEPQRLVERLKQAGIAWAGKPALTAAAPTSGKHAARHESGGSETHPPLGGTKGGSDAASEASGSAHRARQAEGRRDEPKREPRREERHREARHDSHREETKPAKAGPKLEIRVERL